jgi:hypothetical protein
MLDSDGALVLGLGDESLSASFDVEDSATLESLIACYDRATKFGRDAELAEIGRGLYRWLNGKFREVEALAGPALAAELAAVVDGRLLTPQPDALGPCVELEWVPRPSIELGFEPASVVEGVLRGVDPSSEAYAKGLRDGQRIDDLIMPRRVDQEARISTGDPNSSDGRRSSSIDVNGPPIDVPRYRMRAGARAQDPACTRWFADLGDADR